MSKSKLSERLIESAEKIIEKCFEHPFVTELLMNGSAENSMAVLSHMCKTGEDTIDVWLQIFKTAVNKTENQKEKELFESIANGFLDYWNKWLQSYNQEFGPLDSQFASQPMTQTVWLYKQHLLKEALIGNMTNLLVTIFPAFYFISRVNKFVENNDNFKPNIYFKFLSFSDFDLEKSIDLFKSLIDERENEVSDEEEKRLEEVFKRSLVNELLLVDSGMKEEKWIEL
jgi:thiaminase